MEFVYALLPVIASAVTWIVSRRKRNNDFLSQLQSSIDLLTTKYTDTLKELIEVKEQNAKLLQSQGELTIQVENFRKENNMLKGTIDELNQRLSGIKTITKAK